MDQGQSAGAPYKPLAPNALYSGAPDEWAARLKEQHGHPLSPFATPTDAAKLQIVAGARQGHNFAAERANGDANVFDAAVGYPRAAGEEKARHCRGMVGRVARTPWHRAR